MNVRNDKRRKSKAKLELITTQDLCDSTSCLRPRICRRFYSHDNQTGPPQIQPDSTHRSPTMKRDPIKHSKIGGEKGKYTYNSHVLVSSLQPIFLKLSFSNHTFTEIRAWNHQTKNLPYRTSEKLIQEWACATGTPSILQSILYAFLGKLGKKKKKVTNSV